MPVHADPFEDWLDKAPYTLKRKEELKIAHAGIVGDYPHDHLSQRIDSFIKLEAYPEYKEARWINSRHDEFKAWSGRYFKAIEDALYKKSAFIKHVPVHDRAARVSQMRRDGFRYYENDYKAFESHFRPEVMDAIECQLYKYCLKDTPGVADYICRTLTGVNKLVTQCGLRAKVKGRRMSGDMCTSLGNGFTNYMLYKYILHTKGGHGKALVEGDDGLFACDVKLTAKDFEAIGWTVEIKELDDPCRGHFCGMTFADTGDTVKDPRRVFETFGWTSSFLHAGPHVMDSLLRSKALSLAYELPQCPIVGVLARVALQLTEGVELTHLVDRRRSSEADSWEAVINSPIPEFSPSMRTRELVSDLFGVPVLTQLAVERALRDHDLDLVAQLLPPTTDIAHYAARYLEVT